MDSIHKRTVRYFISYTRNDGHLSDRLLRELKYQLAACNKYQFLPWRDTAIQAGEDWHVEIQHAIRESDFGLLLVSPAFFGNNYVAQHELTHFVGGNKPCIPVTLREIDFTNQDLRGLGAFQFFGFTPPRNTCARSFEGCTSAKHRTAFAHALFQTIVARLDKHFEASTSTASLPSPTTSAAASTIQRTFACQFRAFRGRGEELEKLDRMFLNDRKCAGAVIGAFGGMGKTALANQFCSAHGVESLFDVTVGASAKTHYLDIDAFGLQDSGRRPTDHAAETVRKFLLEVGSQLKLRDPGARPDDKLEDDIRAAVRSKRSLFLLDNLETIDQTNAVLNLLRRLCSPPDQKFLITARELPDSLGPAIRALPINRLQHVDSCLLVRDLLEDLDACLAATLPDDSETIRAILTRAAGHPLALRLLTGKLVAQGESAILTMPDPCAATNREQWSGEFFRFVFDEQFLSYLGSIAVDVACVIAPYAHGMTERDLVSACRTADPQLTPEQLEKAIQRLLRSFCVHREHAEGQAVLAMHPLTREFFLSLQA